MTDPEAYLAIEQLHRTYADIATRRAFDEIAAITTDDVRFVFTRSTGEVTEFEGAAAFADFGAQTLGGLPFILYIPVNFVVSVDADGSARGRTYILELSELESGEWKEAYGVYADVFTRVDGRWLYAERNYRAYGMRTDGKLMAFPLRTEPLQ